MAAAPATRPEATDALGPPPSLGPARLTVLLLAGAVFGSVSLVYPFGRDQASYAYSAWAMLQGEMLYSEVFVFKPPMTSLTHALALLVFGHSMTSIRLLDLAWTMAASLAVARCAAHLLRDRDEALVAGLLVPFFHYLMDWWATAQTDGWMGLPAVLALLVALRTRQSDGHVRAAAFAAGGLMGIALLYKYVAAAFLPGLALAFVPALRRHPLSTITAAATGLVLPLLACAAWLWTRGAWDAFVDTQLNLIPDYVSSTRTSDRSYGVLTYLGCVWHYPSYQPHVLVLPGLVVAAARVIRREGGRGPLIALAWWGGGVCSYLGQGKLFDYHALAMVPGLALLGSVGLTTLARLVGRVVRTTFLRRAMWLTVPVLLVGQTWYPAAFGRLAGVVLRNETLEKWWLESDYGGPDYWLANSLGAGLAMRRNTRPEDTIFVWGFDATIAFVAERQVTSRFIYNYPFAVAWGDRRGAYEAELMAALRASPPTIFVVASDDAMPHVTGNRSDSRQLLEQFADLKEFLATRYRAVATIGRYEFYRLVAP